MGSRRRQPAVRRLCSFEGCDRIHMARGWCNSHYLQWYNGRELVALRPQLRKNLRLESSDPDACSFEGCDRPMRTKRSGICNGHYAQQRLGLPLRPIRELRPCSFTDCPNNARSGSLCGAHHRQLARWGELRPLKEATGRTVTAEGYVRVYYPEHLNAMKAGWVSEHVKVMSEILGRPLFPDENVHHINGVRDDNRPENLELWSASQPKGQRVEDKLAWAKMILERYTA